MKNHLSILVRPKLGNTGFHRPFLSWLPAFFLIVCCLSAAALTARAADTTYTWSGGGGSGNTDLSTGANWTGGSAPPNDGTADLDFAGTVSLNPDVQTNYSINSLTFASGAGSFLLSGDLLTIGAGGLTQDSSNLQTLDEGVMVGADQSWSFASGAQPLAIEGNLTLAGTLTVNSGTIAVFGGVTIRDTESYNLDGGTLLTSSVSGAANYGTFNFDGGTLQASGNTSSFVTGLAAAEVQANGAFIDTNGYSVTIGQALDHDLSLGSTPDGGLTLNGRTPVNLTGGDGGTLDPGTLTLTGVNTYTGATTIQTGTLVLGANSSIADSSAVNLNSVLAVLDISAGDQTIQDLSGVAGSTVNLGASSLTLGTSDSTTFAGAINGSTGSVIKQGSGVLTLTGMSYSSGLLVAAGDEQTGTVTINNGAIVVGMGGFLTNMEVEVMPGASFNVAGGDVDVGLADYFVVNSYNVNSSDPNSSAEGSTDLSSGTISTSHMYVNGIFDQSGGTNTIESNVLEPSLFISGGGGTVGSYNLSGGTLAAPFIYVGGINFASEVEGSGTFNQTGGQVTTEYVYVESYGGQDSTYNLSGGTLTMDALEGTAGATNIFDFNGGTLQAGENNSSFLGGLAAANVQAGAAIIDTNGYSITIAQPLLHDSNLGSTPDGGLTVEDSSTNPGTLTLTGVNTYTGATTIDGGTLAMGASGSIADSSGVNLAASGATFDISAGDQTIGDLSGVAGTTVNLGASSLTVTEAAGDSTTFAGVIQDGGSGGSLTKDGSGTLTLTGANIYSGPTQVEAGTLTVGTGGSLTGSEIEVNNTTTFDVAGGSVNTGTAPFELGNTPALTKGIATVNLSSGTISSDEIDIGSATASIALFNQTGGTITAGEIDVSANTGSSGTYDLSGGQVNSTIIYVGYDNTGTVNQSAGALTSNTLMLADLAGSSGTYNQQGGSDTATTLYVGEGDGNGTYNLEGGTLVTGRIALTTEEVAGLDGTGTFNFGGGTLQASGSNIGFMTGLTAAYVQGGGAIIDTNGYDIEIDQPLLHDPALGLAPDGGLTKQGAGTLTLTGSNTYTGGTTVSDGFLNVANTVGSGTGTGAVNVDDGASLGGTGIIATTGVTSGTALNIATGATLSPSGGSGESHLTLALNAGTTMNLTLGAKLVFDLDSSTALSDEVVITGGTLTLNSQSISDFTFNTETGFGPGTYTLINADAGITGSLQTGAGASTETVDGYQATLVLEGIGIDQDLDLEVGAVPEPSTWALILIGGGLLFVGTRRRNPTLSRR